MPSTKATRQSTRSSARINSNSSSSSNSSASPSTPSARPSKRPKVDTGRVRELLFSEDEESEPASSEDEGLKPSQRQSTKSKAPSLRSTPSTRASRSKPGVQYPPTPESTPSKRKARAAAAHHHQQDVLPPSTPTKRKTPQPQKTQQPEVQRVSTSEQPGDASHPVPTPVVGLNKDDVESRHQQQQQEHEDQTSARQYYSAANLRLLQSCILTKLRGHQPLPSAAAAGAADTSAPEYLPSLEVYERDVRNSLERTISEDEGNCTLLVGPRGVGKSTLVQHTLHALRQKHGSDGFLLVKLNGLVHNTDRLALRDIARQLCAPQSQELTASVDDDGASFTSHAATLASLLAILEPSASTSTSAKRCTKAIIFVLDEFDLFALRDARQSFLYCLLDIVQSHRRGGGMAVLGLSSRIDCLNMLEKRLKSRCQNRVLHVLGHHRKWADVARRGLQVQPEALSSLAETGHDEELLSLVQDWNTIGVETFLASDTAKSALEPVLAMSSKKADVFDALMRLVTDLHIPSDGCDMASIHARPLASVSTSRIKRTLAGLSLSELTVLVSLKHALTEQETFNMTMALQSYRNHLKRQPTSQKGLNHGSFAKAFEQLKSMGILVDHQSTASSHQARGNATLWRMAKLVPWMKHIDDAIVASSRCPEPLKRFCKSPDA